MADEATPTPHEDFPDQGGGGTPNGRDDFSTSPQISPTSDLVPVVSLDDDTAFADQIDSVRSMLPEIDEPVTALAEMKPRWHGGPTRAMLKALKDEVRVPNWNQDAAAMVLQLIGDGFSLTRACEMAGVSRAAVLGWSRLVPEFGELLEVMRKGLGWYNQDKAHDLADEDPAKVRSLLALATSYDKTIGKGADVVDGAPTLNVNVVW